MSRASTHSGFASPNQHGIVVAPPGKPPDIRTFVVDLARMAGFRPSKRQPLPGTAKIWQAWRKFKTGLEFVQSEGNRMSQFASTTGC